MRGRRRPRTGRALSAAVASAVVGALTLSACGTSGSTAAPTPSDGRTSHAVTTATPPAAAAAPAGTTSAPAPRTPDRCAHNPDRQRVIVSIARQQLWMCARHRTVYRTPVTTGMVGPDTSTPTGTYWIQGRNRDTTLSLLSGATYDVKYWIPFDAPLFGFHDSPWQRFPYGSQQYRTRGSHGCIHMPLRAIAHLYRFAGQPTAVRIS